MFLLWAWVEGLPGEFIFSGEFILPGELMGLNVSETDFVGD